MSKASTTRTIKFISKAGTYTALIMCPDGDIYQEWEGTESDATVSPNFEETQPILNFVCMSSRVAEGIATPDKDGMHYFFNGLEIAFNSDGISTGLLLDSDGTLNKSFAGCFKKFAPTGDNPYYGLQILKNLVVASGFAPATIKMVAEITYGTQSDNIQATYTIPIQKATGTSYRVTIVAGDAKSFVITEKGGSCVLKAMAYQNYGEITKDLTYVWEKMGASGWETIEGKTAQTLTVSGDSIDTYGEYRVTVNRSGVEIGKDIQGVMDASDPYDIDARPYPEDEAISEDETDTKHAQVTYTPWIVKRGTNTQAIKDAKFYFVVKDAAGVILTPAKDQGVAFASYAVTREMCMQCGGDVSVTITSKD